MRVHDVQMELATDELDEGLANFDVFFRDEHPKMVALALGMTGLYYIEDRSIADIAEILEIAEGTVKATLSKARSNLSTALSLSTDEEVGS